MLKDVQGTDEIFAYIKELMEKPNGKYNLAIIFGLAKRKEELNNKESEIEKILDLSRPKRVENISFVGDDIVIAKVVGKDETYFYPIVNGKRCFEIADTFDYALAIALGEKYGVRSYASQAIASILRIEEYEAKKKPKTFIDKCVSGETTIDQIDDYIDEWHVSKEDNGELYEFLGLTEEEYAEWMPTGKTEVLERIVSILKARR